jgi:hypothetical protein
MMNFLAMTQNVQTRLPAGRATPMMGTMDALSAVGGATPGADASVDLEMLKKSQDLAKQQSAELLSALPPPKSPSPPGVGGKIDVSA